MSEYSHPMQMRSNNQVSNQNMSQASTVRNESKISSKSSGVKNYKMIGLIVVMIATFAIVVGGIYMRMGPKKLNDAGFNDLKIETYKSAYSDDENKELKNSFVMGDPIQVKLNYKATSDQADTLLKLNVFKLESDDNRDKGLFGNPFQIPLKSEGERYITIPSTYTQGKYRVEVWTVEGETLQTFDFDVM